MPLGVPRPTWFHTPRRVFRSGVDLHQASLEYSDTNEDIATSLQALDIQRGDVVVGITGSADLLLRSLRYDPAFVAGYDLNPAQTALGEIKRQAVATLPYPDYLELFGYRSSGRRCELLAAVLKPLSEEVRAFWQRDDMQEAVERGLWRAGGATRQDLASWKAALSQLEARVGPHDLQVVLGMEGTAEEREAIRTKIARVDPKYAEPAIRNKNHFKFDAFRYKPGMAHEPAVARYAADFLPDDSVAPPISEADYDRIRQRVHRISFQTFSLHEAIEQMPAEAFDRAYLSNVTEYLTLAQERALVDTLLQKAKPGAIVVLLYVALSPAQQRDLLDHRTWSERGLARLLRASELKARLEEALEGDGPDRSAAQQWLRGAGRALSRLSRGGAAQTFDRARDAIRNLDQEALSRKAAEGARKSIERVRDYDYVDAGQRFVRATRSAWRETRDRIEEVRQLDGDGYVLIEDEARQQAFYSDLYANLRATYASRSFYAFDYAILRKVARTGPTYDVPRDASS